MDYATYVSEYCYVRYKKNDVKMCELEIECIHCYGEMHATRIKAPQ